MAAGHHLQAAVLLVRRVQGQPGGHARAGLRAEVILVLMERLPARAGRLEVEHRLHRQRLLAQQGGEAPIQPGVQEPAEADRVPPVHVDHARVAAEGVVAAWIDAAEVARIGAGLAQRHVVIAQGSDLVRTEETADERVAGAAVGLQVLRFDHRRPPGRGVAGGIVPERARGRQPERQKSPAGERGSEDAAERS